MHMHVKSRRKAVYSSYTGFSNKTISHKGESTCNRLFILLHIKVYTHILRRCLNYIDKGHHAFMLARAMYIIYTFVMSMHLWCVIIQIVQLFYMYTFVMSIFMMHNYTNECVLACLKRIIFLKFPGKGYSLWFYWCHKNSAACLLERFVYVQCWL